MLESLFFALFGFAVFLCVLTVLDKEENYFIWPVLSFVMWIVLAISVHMIEMPYAFITSTNTVVTGLTTYTGGTYLMWLFAGLALVFMMIFVIRMSEIWTRKVK